jgi:hypothetical protein
VRPAHIRERAAHLWVPEAQVRRDVLISQVLHVLPSMIASGERVIFFGGTARCRIQLDGFRLSEDIDLLAEHPRRPPRPLVTASTRSSPPRSPCIMTTSRRPSPSPPPRPLVRQP